MTQNANITISKAHSISEGTTALDNAFVIAILDFQESIMDNAARCDAIRE